jgi:hypothetical protein
VPYEGMGSKWRRWSQYRLMATWEKTYHIRSAIEVPYDESTKGIDWQALSCPSESRRTITTVKGKWDFVWNSNFLQRRPKLIFKMKELSNRYVTAFVSNGSNWGWLLYRLFHLFHNAPHSPEYGDKRFMCVYGLTKLFECAGLRVLEAGYFDLPLFPDTFGCTIKGIIGGWEQRQELEIPIPFEWLRSFEYIARPKRFFAHHIYVLGEIP